MVLIAIIIIFYNVIPVSGLGDSILYPTDFKYSIAMDLEELNSNLGLFFKVYSKKHEVTERFIKKEKYMEGFSFVRYVSINQYIDKSYSVLIYAEKKESIFNIFLPKDEKTEKNKISIEINFNYNLKNEDDDTNYEQMFKDFIGEFENYAQKNKWNLKKIN